MKLGFTFIMVLLLAFQQDPNSKIYKTTKASIDFSSEAPMEIIKARSEKLLGLIDTEKNSFAFQVSVITFEGFNSDLQREHFNENYMESTKYPKIKFLGKIATPLNYSTDFEKDVDIKGKLSIHGVTKEVSMVGKMKKSGSQINCKAEFEVQLSDYNISIPTIVDKKLAKVIKIKVDANMTPKQ